jgi:hypothetical protein
VGRSDSFSVLTCKSLARSDEGCGFGYSYFCGEHCWHFDFSIPGLRMTSYIDRILLATLDSFFWTRIYSGSASNINIPSSSAIIQSPPTFVQPAEQFIDLAGDECRRMATTTSQCALLAPCVELASASLLPLTSLTRPFASSTSYPSIQSSSANFSA